jgi:hypothetical protein
VHVVPRAELAFFVLDDQETAAGHDQEALLGVLLVVVAESLAGLEDVDVEPELAERPLAFEVAVEAERAGVAPASFPGVDDEPAVDVGDESVLRLSKRCLGHPKSLSRARQTVASVRGTRGDRCPSVVRAGPERRPSGAAPQKRRPRPARTARS